MDARLSYRQEAARGASPLHRVVMLYEQILSDVQHAIGAYQNGQVEARTQAINHALLVIGYLQSTLDRQQGGAVAARLEEFYNLIRVSLCKAQAAGSVAGLRDCMDQVMVVHGAWVDAERRTEGPSAHAPNENTDMQAPETREKMEWKA